MVKNHYVIGKALKTESQSKNERWYTYVDSFDVVSFSYPFF